MKIFKTIKENKDISSLEARLIQYSKIVIAIIFGIILLSLLSEINDNIKNLKQDYLETFDAVDSININFV